MSPRQGRPALRHRPSEEDWTADRQGRDSPLPPSRKGPQGSATKPAAPTAPATGYAPRPPPRPKAISDYKRSEEHTSELQSLMRISYAVFCLKKKKTKTNTTNTSNKS